jgi:hypothetical protein
MPGKEIHMTVRVKFQVLEVGSGLLTLETIHTESRLSEQAQASLLAAVATAREAVINPKQHNGSKVVTMVTWVDDLYTPAYSAVGILTDAETFATEQALLGVLVARLEVQQNKK